ncbi:MAG: Asp-tRNA(Asn)/Glu-tRNA(Gln) amidotransferase subunit GatB [Bacilli bacterium]
MDNYKVLIGLEMHCEISETNTKVFSSAENSFNEIANSNIRPVDMAFPGTLPVVNKEAVKKALMASIILNCKQPEFIYFERKNYYYPDLPKGFQITQETKPAPIGIYGQLKYVCNDEFKTVRINNIHLEEDAASTDHFSRYSAIDYNRAGVPLLELVTEPDFHSADEAVSFLETMRTIYQYTNISEADSKKGQIRCDVNVSIMDVNLDESDPKNWGTKVEIKNVNSFGGVKDSINFEIKRQIELKEDKEYDKMEQQTRRWDEESGTTVYMRSKVDAIDYKYFVEPNIPKFKLSQKWIEEIKELIPRLANERKESYINNYNLSNYDATILVKEKSVSDYFEQTINCGADPKLTSNWITSIILGHLNKNNVLINEIFVTPKMLKELIELVNTNQISSKQAKEVLYSALTEDKDPVQIINESGIKQIGNDDEILKVILEVLEENIEAPSQYHAGRTNIIDFLVGQVMKKTKGQANPAKARTMMIDEVEKR